MTNFKSRFSHGIDWVRLISFLLKNRGKETFGAGDVRRIVERHMIEHSRNLIDYTAAESAINESIKLLKVNDISGLARIGPVFDGGYIGLLDPPPNFLLSGGAGKNIDFEIELARRGTKVHVYDPTVTQLPKVHPRVTHQKIALCMSGDRRFKDSTNLKGALEKFNLVGDETIWLKLDIESSEWELLVEEKDLLRNFTQVFIEFHDTYKLALPDFRKNFLTVLRALERDFQLISMSSNNWQGVANYGESFIPVTFEATYLNKIIPTNQLRSGAGEKHIRLNNTRRLRIPNKPFTRGTKSDL